MQKTLKLIFLLLVLYLTIFIVINPQPCIKTAQNAVKLCLETVIPSLFPFFVCSGLLSALGFSGLCTHFLSPIMRPLFNLPGAGALTLFMGILSGYPVGAATAVDLYKTGQCTKAEAERMLAFCNNSGPLFIIGVVGSSCLGSPAVGRYLYASHIIAALIVGVIFRFYKCTEAPSHLLPPSFTANKKAALISFGGIIDSSVFSILKVCGFVVFFAVFAETLPDNPYLYSLVEITGGIKSLSRLDTPYLLPFISFFLAFSGFSVLFQVSAIISPQGLSLKPYILGKLLQGALSFVITLVLFKLFPLTREAFAPSTDFVSTLSPLSLGLASVVISIFTAFVLLLIIILSTIRKKVR